MVQHEEYLGNENQDMLDFQKLDEMNTSIAEQNEYLKAKNAALLAQIQLLEVYNQNNQLAQYQAEQYQVYLRAHLQSLLRSQQPQHQHQHQE